MAEPQYQFNATVAFLLIHVSGCVKVAYPPLLCPIQLAQSSLSSPAESLALVHGLDWCFSNRYI